MKTTMLKQFTDIVAVYYKNRDGQDTFLISYDAEGIIKVSLFGPMSEYDVALVAREFVTVDKILRLSSTEFKKAYPYPSIKRYLKEVA